MLFAANLAPRREDPREDPTRCETPAGPVTETEMVVEEATETAVETILHPLRASQGSGARVHQGAGIATSGEGAETETLPPGEREGDDGAPILTGGWSVWFAVVIVPSFFCCFLASFSFLDCCSQFLSCSIECAFIYQH